MGNPEIDEILHRFLYTFAPDGTVRPERYTTLELPEAKAALETIITQRCIEARIDEVKKIWSHAREHTITDIEMIEHHTGLDFIEAVDTKHLEDRIAALSKEGE